MLDISVIILTLNEELHIRRCIENVRSIAKQIFVVDCFSTDRTVDIAKELGAEVVAIHNNPDGTNINANCGSTHMEELQARVVYEKANVGLAFDGDADRLLAVDEKGKRVDGDEIMAIVGNHM